MKAFTAMIVFIGLTAQAEKAEYWGLEKHTPIELVEAQSIACSNGGDGGGTIDPPPRATKLSITKQNDGTFSASYDGAGWYGIDKIFIGNKLKCKANKENKLMVDCKSDDNLIYVSTSIKSSVSISAKREWTSDKDFYMKYAKRSIDQLQMYAHSPSIEALTEDQQRSLAMGETGHFDLHQNGCKVIQ